MADPRQGRQDGWWVLSALRQSHPQEVYHRPDLSGHKSTARVDEPRSGVERGRRLPLKDESLHTVPCNSFTDGRFADPVDGGKSLKPTPIDDRRRGHDEPDATVLGRSLRPASRSYCR